MRHAPSENSSIEVPELPGAAGRAEGAVTNPVDRPSDIAALRWPEEESARQRLARDGVPRLLLVAEAIEPPVCADCLEDWIRVPTDDADLHARLSALAARRSVHKPLSIDEYGVVHLGNSLRLLGPAERALARPLIEDFGKVVSTATLEQSLEGKPHDRSLSLRILMSRLRKRLAPFGVSVSCVRNVGYVMHPSDPPDPAHE